MPLRNNSAKEAGNSVDMHQILWEVEGNCSVSANVLGTMGMRGRIRLPFLAIVLQDACSVAVWSGPVVGRSTTLGSLWDTESLVSSLRRLSGPENAVSRCSPARLTTEPPTLP